MMMKSTLQVLLIATLLASPATVLAQHDCTDSVYVYVEGSRVGVMHTGALYNCCNSGFEYDVTIEQDRIIVVENEILVQPCYCICCIDCAMVIENVPAGEYLLEFYWLELDWEVWVLEIVVGEVGQFGAPYVEWTDRSDCYGSSTEVEDEDSPQTSWGMIKLMFK
jgi:hypothetical protein